MKIANGLLILVGIIAMVAGLLFDTSIESSRGDRVHNIGLMNDRLALILVGAALFIGGLILKSKSLPSEASPGSEIASYFNQLDRLEVFHRLISIVCAVQITLHPLSYILSSTAVAYIASAVALGILAFRKGETPKILRQFWLSVMLFVFLAALGFAVSFLAGESYAYYTVYEAGANFDVFSPLGAISIYILAPCVISVIAFLMVRKL